MEPLAAIRELRRIAQPLLVKEPDSVKFPVHFTFRLVLERLESGLGSLELLVGSNLLQHDHAIGLICRNILSDTLITGYIIKSLEVVERKPKDLGHPASDCGDQSSTGLEGRLHEKLYSLYYDDLQRMDKIVELFKQAGTLSDEDVKQYREKHAMPNSIYNPIREYAKEFGTRPFPSNTAIYTWFLKSDQQDHWVKELQRAFDAWIHFSKYEHLGWYAYDLTRNLDKNGIRSRLKLITRLAALLQSSCHEMLGQKEALNESLTVYEGLLPFPADTLKSNA